jgi:hypothetical protein
MSGSQGAHSRGGRYRAFEGTRFLVCGYEGADREALVERIDALGGSVLSRSQHQHQTPHVVVCGNVNDPTYRVSCDDDAGGGGLRSPKRPGRGKNERERRLAVAGGARPRHCRCSHSPPTHTKQTQRRTSRPSTTRSPPS